MGYKALVILELPNASEEQKTIFHTVLLKELWFNQNWSRGSAIEAIESDLKKAQEISGVEQIQYALQLDIQLVVKSCQTQP